jgi:hypothetical protein
MDEAPSKISRHCIGMTMKRKLAIALFSVAAATTPLAFANSPILIDRSNRAIGYVIDSSQYCKSADLDAVLTAQNYLACLDPTTGRIDDQARVATNSALLFGNPALFIDSLCTGQAYLSTNTPSQFSGGEVVNTPDLGIMYLPLGSVSSSHYFQIESDAPGDCEPYGNSLPGIEAYRNTYATTGFSSVPYAPPLSIKVLPDSALTDEIFFDMFDSEY